jgi:hypothetical protein
MTMMLAMLLVQVREELVADVLEMDAFSWIFMLVSLGAVTTLTVWSFSRILRGKRHFDPDGTGPASPPVKGRLEQR